MTGLRQQIEAAWKDGTSTAWMYEDSIVVGTGVTKNIQMFGQMWQVTIHYNNCDIICDRHCIKAAANLVKIRVGCIKRGMPDMSPDEEQKIMQKAFVIHANKIADKKVGHMNLRPGVMTCSWSENLTDVCHCFEEARHESIVKKIVAETPKILISREDMWFEPRFE